MAVARSCIRLVRRLSRRAVPPPVHVARAAQQARPDKGAAAPMLIACASGSANSAFIVAIGRNRARARVDSMLGTRTEPRSVPKRNTSACRVAMRRRLERTPSTGDMRSPPSGGAAGVNVGVQQVQSPRSESKHSDLWTLDFWTLDAGLAALLLDKRTNHPRHARRTACRDRDGSMSP